MRGWALVAALVAALCGSVASGGRRRAASLGEMLREVEALMEDTQHKLRNAVQEVKGPGCPFCIPQGAVRGPGMSFLYPP